VQQVAAWRGCCCEGKQKEDNVTGARGRVAEMTAHRIASR